MYRFRPSSRQRAKGATMETSLENKVNLELTKNTVRLTFNIHDEI